MIKRRPPVLEVGLKKINCSCELCDVLCSFFFRPIFSLSRHPSALQRRWFKSADTINEGADLACRDPSDLCDQVLGRTPRWTVFGHPSDLGRHQVWFARAASNTNSSSALHVMVHGDL